MTSHILSLAGIFLLLSLNSCSQNAEPIKYGKDNCSYCNMTIMKKNYGGEIMSKKGKAFKFDDVGCLREFLVEGKIKRDDVGKIYLNEIEQGELIDSDKLTLIKNETFRTPMASHIVAVKKENTKTYLSETGSSEVDISEWLK